MLVDTPKSAILDLSVDTYNFRAYTNRSLLVGNIMASPPVRRYIARRAHVPAEVLQVASPVTPDFPRPLASDGEKHSSDILKSPDQYRLSVQVNPTVPVVDVYAEAPTAEAAQQLANGAVDGMKDYLRDLGTAQSIPPFEQVHLQQLGRAKGAVIDPGISAKVALLTFFLVFGASSIARPGPGPRPCRAGSWKPGARSPRPTARRERLMEIVSILKVLEASPAARGPRRRADHPDRAVPGLPGLVPAPVAGEQAADVGFATARVIIAARTQPAFDLESEITDTLGTRAALLADLLSADDVRARIARGAGLKPDEVAVLTPVWGPPTIDIALPLSATEAASLAYEPYVLTVTSEGNIPIIALRATGRDPLRAAKVANAGIAAIDDLIAKRSPGRPNIVVERLGPATAWTVSTGPKKAIAIAAAMVVFAVWCSAIVFVSWFTAAPAPPPPDEPGAAVLPVDVAGGLRGRWFSAVACGAVRRGHRGVSSCGELLTFGVSAVAG